MMLRALAVALSLGCATAWRAPGDTRPNIIIYFPDTIRAEAMGTYGHKLTKTPNADKLASQGVLFDDAHAQHSQCSPSRCAMMSGRYMHVLGHRTQTHLLQAYEANIFSYLKAANYTTLLLGKNDVLSAAAFNNSFTYWEGDIGISQGANAFKYHEAGYYSFAATAGEANGNSSANGDLKAVRLTADFLNSDPPEPFAIFLSGLGGHPPYGAPSDYMNMYSAAEVQAAAPLRPLAPGANKPGYVGPNGIEQFRNLTSFPDDFFYSLTAVYLGRVTYTDWILGQLMEALDASPLASNTALIMTSDHGEYAGSWRGLVEKWPGGLDDVLTHVPLIARIPGGAAGLRVPYPVMLIDMLPTLLDLAGVNATDRHFGLSLAPYLQGADPATVPRHPYIYSEAGYAPGTMEVEPLDPAQRSVYADPTNLYWPRGREELGRPPECTRAVMQANESWKIVYRPGGVSELYNRSGDPQELQNLWGTPATAGVQAAMLSDLLEWFVTTADVTPALEDDRNLPPAPVPPFPWPPVPKHGPAKAAP